MDREKVIDRIHDAIDVGVCIDLFMDILELLKEQEDLGTELTNAVELIHKKNERIEKLLKEQEAVEPKTGHWIYKKNDDMFMCSCCEKYSIRNDYPYCHWCGAKMEKVGEVDGTFQIQY